MMKKALALTLMLLCLLLTGCSGSTVIYQELTRPEDSEPAPAPEASGGVWKTGLAILADTTGSASAALADYDVTVAAVLVDDEGVSLSVPLTALPPHAQPGDMLRREEENFLPLPDETKARRLRTLELQERLRRR